MELDPNHGSDIDIAGPPSRYDVVEFFVQPRNIGQDPNDPIPRLEPGARVWLRAGQFLEREEPCWLVSGRGTVPLSDYRPNSDLRALTLSVRSQVNESPASRPKCP